MFSAIVIERGLGSAVGPWTMAAVMSLDLKFLGRRVERVGSGGRQSMSALGNRIHRTPMPPKVTHQNCPRDVIL